MGRKRKHKDSSDREILKKLRRLEKEIRSRRRRGSYDSLSSESRSDYENQTHYPSEHEEPSCSPTNGIQGVENPDPTVTIQLPVNEAAPNETLEGEIKQAENCQQPSFSDKNVESETATEQLTSLDDEILTLLGDAPKVDSPVGPNVHNDIASRLQEVLQNGLKKEQKDILVQDYPIPGNCPLFAAPVLNAEVKAAISDFLEKKDISLAARQRQVGTALAALVKSMDILVTDKSDVSQQVLKHVSSACRLICDSHYIDTQLRRSFLISSLNNKMKDTLKESKRGTHLFGEGLAEKLKATKAVTRSSHDLKFNKSRSAVNKNLPSTSSQSNSFAQSGSHNLNWKHPQSSQTWRPAPSFHRSAGTPSTSFHRSRVGTDNRRRHPSTRARGSAHYKRRQ